jgi:hypothetical protein
MPETETSNRTTLIRNTVRFQLKLMADGFRDLVLLPVSLFASLIGLLRGGEDAERELNQVIELGRQSERWINLFGTHDIRDNSDPKVSIDAIFAKAEEALKQQYEAQGTSRRAQTEIDEALHAAHEKARADGLEGKR